MTHGLEPEHITKMFTRGDRFWPNVDQNFTNLDNSRTFFLDLISAHLGKTKRTRFVLSLLGQKIDKQIKEKKIIINK